MEDKYTAFFFCRTPLQSIIANKLIVEDNINAIIVYHATSTNEKHKIYFDKIATNKKYFIPWCNSKYSQTFNDAIAWFKIPKEIRNKKYDVLYVSSLTSIVFSGIRGKNKEALLYTFDDGTINLNTKDNIKWWYYEPRNVRIVKRFIRGAFNKEIIENIDRHYTIFDRNKIIKWTKNIYELSLFRKKMKHIDSAKKVRVLLGSWTNNEDLKKKYKCIIDSNKFDLFIPHPADTDKIDFVSKIANIDIAELCEKYIAEDIILFLIDQGYCPIVYGFGSTSLINLKEIVPTVNIRIYYSDRYNQINDMMLNFGVHTIKVHEI